MANNQTPVQIQRISLHNLLWGPRQSGLHFPVRKFNDETCNALGVGCIHMACNRANVINPEFLEAFESQLRAIPPEAPLIITGNDTFFSAGLDLRICDRLDRKEFSALIEHFQHLLLALVSRPGITAALVCGHAVAGGFILASATDKIILFPGDYKVGMNEKTMGFSLPVVPEAILKSAYNQQFEKIMSNTAFYSPDQFAALTKIVLWEAVRTKDICEELIAQSTAPGWLSKKQVRQQVIREFVREKSASVMQRFYAGWWSGQAVKNRRQMLKKMKSMDRPGVRS